MIRGAAEDAAEAAEAAAAAAAEAAAQAGMASFVAWLALAVSVVAAAFTGWQAWTAHRARVDPLRADWAFEHQPWASNNQNSGWYLRNIGGSTATDVTLTAMLSKPTKAGETTRSWKAVAPVAPAERRLLEHTDRYASPGQWFMPKEGSKELRAVRFAKGVEPPVEARRPYEQWGTVTWTDDRQKERTKSIPLF